jgi:hypothetical protein
LRPQWKGKSLNWAKSPLFFIFLNILLIDIPINPGNTLCLLTLKFLVAEKIASLCSKKSYYNKIIIISVIVQREKLHLSCRIQGLICI